MTNTHKESDAQKELTESNEELYYPILDRINESLQEKYISDLLKERTKSPFSVSIGNDLGQYGDMLASSLIISLYNGCFVVTTHQSNDGSLRDWVRWR